MVAAQQSARDSRVYARRENVIKRCRAVHHERSI
jgi:hypothetical protein